MACIFVHINIYRVYIVTYQSCHFCTYHTCLYFIQPPTPPYLYRFIRITDNISDHFPFWYWFVPSEQQICTCANETIYMRINILYAFCAVRNFFFLKVFWWKGTFLTTKLSLASKKYTYTGFENVIGRPLPLPTCTFIKADFNDFKFFF